MMTPLFLTTILTCNQVLGIVNRISQNLILTDRQKHELVLELRTYIPSCPVYIKPNERTK